MTRKSTAKVPLWQNSAGGSVSCVHLRALGPGCLTGAVVLNVVESNLPGQLENSVFVSAGKIEEWVLDACKGRAASAGHQFRRL